MSKDNGGSAFPFGQTSEHNGQLVNGWGSEGMTLRDYFAAKAMQGVFASNSDYQRYEDIADDAYRMADAMLKVRNK
jgi:hypothetical protein